MVLENIGDLQIPNGTKVEWSFNGIDIDSVFIVVDDSVKVNSTEINNGFAAEKSFFKSTKYNVFIQNEITSPELALSYSVEVIPDLFPEIKVEQMIDSMQLTRYYFKGTIGDDYGFSNLGFHFNIDNSDSSITIPFVKMLTDQDFYFVFDFNDLNQTKGVVSYYFSVSDNDAVNNLGQNATQYQTNQEAMYRATNNQLNQQEMAMNEGEQESAANLASNSANLMDAAANIPNNNTSALLPGYREPFRVPTKANPISTKGIFDTVVDSKTLAIKK
jgi:hypothetical protein